LGILSSEDGLDGSPFLVLLQWFKQGNGVVAAPAVMVWFRCSMLDEMAEVEIGGKPNESVKIWRENELPRVE
jgi:hypothetical protein